jgi:hypothetical protein
VFAVSVADLFPHSFAHTLLDSIAFAFPVHVKHSIPDAHDDTLANAIPDSVAYEHSFVFELTQSIAFLLCSTAAGRQPGRQRHRRLQPLRRPLGPAPHHHG